MTIYLDLRSHKVLTSHKSPAHYSAKQAKPEIRVNSHSACMKGLL